MILWLVLIVLVHVLHPVLMIVLEMTGAVVECVLKLVHFVVEVADKIVILHVTPHVLLKVLADAVQDVHTLALVIVEWIVTWDA